MKNKKIVLVVFAVFYFILVGIASAEPVQIESVSDLDLIRGNLAGDFILEENLTLDFSNEEDKIWISIGNYETPFTGKFDGNNKTITILNHADGLDSDADVVTFAVQKSGVALDNDEFDGQGLFGNVKSNGENSGIIENLTVIVQSHLSGGGSDNPTGVLVGYLGSDKSVETAVIKNCFVYLKDPADSEPGAVTLFSVSGKYKVGGLVGVINSGRVEKSGSEIHVNVEKNSVGGLVGYVFDGSVSECYATGDVTVLGEGVYDGNAGGLIGESESGTFSECYATGFVRSNMNAGGFLGHVSGDTEIRDVYATGDIESDLTSAGGLVGFVGKYQTLSIKNSYA